MHTEDVEACVPHAKENVKTMLDDRKIPRDDAEVDDLDIPGLIWAMRRGPEWLVVFVQDVNKATITLLDEYCSGQEDKDDGRGYTHCIVVYRKKCTPAAGKEMALLVDRVQMELFSMLEINMCPPRSQMASQYQLLTDEEAAYVRSIFPSGKIATVFTTDPMQRYYNAPIGSIYMVTSTYGCASLQPHVKFREVKKPSS